MVIVIKKGMTSKDVLRASRRKRTKLRRSRPVIDVEKHSGVIKYEGDPVADQREMRRSRG